MGTATEYCPNKIAVWAPQPGPQMALLTCPIPDALFGGARGGGKTDALIGDWIKHIAQWGAAARGILLRRTLPELEEVEARMLEIYPLLGALYSVSKRMWYFPNSARLKLRYLETDADASRYQGHSYSWVAIDEGGAFPSPAPIDRLRATLRSAAGARCVLRLTANPGGPGQEWIKNRYVSPALPGIPWHDREMGTWRVFIPSRVTDNKILLRKDPGYIDRLKGSGPPWLVAAWLHGDWNAVPEGGIFNPAWIQRYRLPPAFSQIVQSWDTAYKDKQINDPSVCTTWGVTSTAFYLLEVWRERKQYPEIKRTMLNCAEKWKPNAILIEDKASGQSLIQELRIESRLPVIAITPVGDKLTRASTVTPFYEAGRVYHPETAPWLLDYEMELATFPQSATDDQVDASSQFLNWMLQRGRRPQTLTARVSSL